MANSNSQLPVFINDGSRDAGTKPHFIILLRSLDPLCDEEAIWKSLSALKLSRKEDIMATPKRIWLVRDKNTRASWGFAFAEYVGVKVLIMQHNKIHRPQQKLFLLRMILFIFQMGTKLEISLGCLSLLRRQNHFKNNMHHRSLTLN